MIDRKPKYTHAMMMTRVAYLRSAVKSCAPKMSLKKRVDIVGKVQRLTDEVYKCIGR